MTRGKETCRILKEIRRQIAEANDIEFVTSECQYKGDCLGTCPKCESEVRYLERQLRARSLTGKAVALAGISAASFAMLMPMTSQAQPLTDNVAPADSITATRVSANKVKGRVKDQFANVLPYASVKNFTDRVHGVVTNIDGEFELTANVGDTLEVSFIGMISKKVCVNNLSEPIEIVLEESEDALEGEFVTIRKSAPLAPKGILFFEIIDENGKFIDAYDGSVEIYKLYVDESGNNTEEIYPSGFYNEYGSPYFYWDEDSDLQDDEGRPLKEVTLLIVAEGYEPVKIKVKYPKRNTKKTIKLKRAKK